MKVSQTSTSTTITRSNRGPSALHFDVNAVLNRCATELQTSNEKKKAQRIEDYVEEEISEEKLEKIKRKREQTLAARLGAEKRKVKQLEDENLKRKNKFEKKKSGKAARLEEHQTSSATNGGAESSTAASGEDVPRKKRKKVVSETASSIAETEVIPKAKKTKATNENTNAKKPVDLDLNLNQKRKVSSIRKKAKPQ